MRREELRRKVANTLDGLFHNEHSFEDMADRLIDFIQSNTESEKIEKALMNIEEQGFIIKAESEANINNHYGKAFCKGRLHAISSIKSILEGPTND